MHTRLVTGVDVPAAIADVLAGGAAIAVAADSGTVPSTWSLDGPALESGAAVLIGTSGSTADPKGVLLTPDAIRAAAEASHHRLGGAGNWVCPLPLHYVAGMMTAARAAAAGTTVTLVPSDLSYLPLLPGRNYVSVVVAQLHRGLESPDVVQALRGFDSVLVGGSAIPVGLVQRVRAAGINLIATYGMAETCGGCVYDGVPLDGVRVELGEGRRISITADFVFAGYRLDSDATAAALDGRTFRTQDRGAWSAGRLQVLGRLDEVVITGGVNVDLGRVQQACDAAFGPGRIALLALPDERWGVRIVALSELDLELAEVRRRVGDSVQPAGLPRELRRVAGLPQTSTGKIDRRGLPQLWAEGS